MKATGIVRRIDDLGRVVIPKEIRRTMRIKEGDPLEIYTDNDGGVIFKKYSPLGELGTFAQQYADVLYKTAGFPVLVCDRDHIVAAAGIPKRTVLERRISPVLEDTLERRANFSYTGGDDRLHPVEGLDFFALISAPIIAEGDICGAIMLVTEDESATATDVETKLIYTAASFLGKQMEE